MTIDKTNNRLVLPTLLNARDLGGLPARDGRRTVYRRFIRADEPSLLAPDDLTKLISYRVTAVIDLRDASEIRRRATPLMSHPQIRYRNISLFGDDADDVKSPIVQIAVSQSLGALYVYVMKERSAYLAETFREMLQTSDGAVLFHCTHGKDRTGIIAALLLLVAGVDREKILENYAITYELIRPLVDPKMDGLPPHMRHILRSDRENMEMLLDYVDVEYEGNIDTYFLRAGLTAREIDSLRGRLLDE